ncbi:MAG TPA: PKD domain-containing protein, partial [Saprospiraceae bacterium]|nr:PKD domain-containing protein [Saprospiraceae bacterium]
TVTLVTAGFEFNANSLEVGFVNTSTGANSYTWDFGDGTFEVNGPANPTHTYAAGGVYTVTMFAYSECGVDTMIQTIGLVSAGEPSWLRQCQLFPNPNRGIFTVAITGVPQPELTFTLFSQMGQLVDRQSLDFKSGTIQRPLDFGAVAPGVYSLQIQGQGEIKYLKVIVTQ